MENQIEVLADLCVTAISDEIESSRPERSVLHPAEMALDPLPLLCTEEEFVDSWLVQHHATAKGVQCGSIDLYRIPNLVVAAGNEFLNNSLIVDPKIMSGWYRHFWADNPGRDLRKKLSLPERTIEEPCVVLFINGCHVYGHTLIEVLPQIHFLTKFLHSVPKLLAETTTPSWFFDILKSGFGIDRKKFIFYDPAQENVLLKHAIVPSLTHMNTELHPANSEVYDTLVRRAGPVALDVRTIFLLREFSNSLRGGRRIIDEELDLAKIAANEFGFSIICPETLPWRDQIRLFSQARIIVGLMSSATHNSVFSCAGSRVGCLGFPALIQSNIGALKKQRNAYVRIERIADKLYSLKLDLFRRFMEKLLIAEKSPTGSQRSIDTSSVGCMDGRTNVNDNRGFRQGASMPVAKVTKDDVAAAYRFLLGRDPSEREISAWLHVASVAELRRLFVASPEFKAKLVALGSLRSEHPQRLSLDVPPILVDWQTDKETEARLLDYVTKTWVAIGKEQPHWSVLSADAFKSENMARNRAAFYASGAGDARRVVAILARHHLTPADRPRMVEYGCGVGRVTPHLAAAFREVIGIDISQSHLALARDVVAESGRQNVRLVLSAAPEFGMTEPFDLWFSYIVLQHNPPPIIAMILRRMFAMLAPGGIAVFQVPTYVPGYRFDVAQYLAAPKQGTIEVHCLPQPVVFRLAAEAGCRSLEVREDSAVGFPWLSDTFVFIKSP